MNTPTWLTLFLLLLSLSITGCATHHPTAGVGTLEPLWPATTATVKTPSGTYPLPSLTPFFPDPSLSNGTAVIVCPGGGYGALMDTYEGADVCRWWNSHGVTAFLLRYHIAPDRHPAPLQDAQRAIRLVRSRATDYAIDPRRIGIQGFSAGGHLAASTATLFHASADPSAPDSLDRVSDRPDFAILVYPVISLLPPLGHVGSRNNLLGPDPSPTLAAELSLETRVSDQTPPSFLVHSRDDKVVDWRNSQSFYDACLAHHVPAQFDLLDHGPHGFGLKTPMAGRRPWTDDCLDFLRSARMLPDAAK